MTGITDMVVVIKLRNKEGIIGKGREGRKERKKEKKDGRWRSPSFYIIFFFFNGISILFEFFLLINILN